MAGPPHHTEGAGSPICGFPRLTQRKSPFSSNATRPPCWWDSSGFCLFTSFASHPPVTKQTCPSPLQSPAAMDAFPSTAPITLMAFQKSFGALQMGEPSEPRMARITPRVSTVPPLPFSGAAVLKKTEGSASPGSQRRGERPPPGVLGRLEGAVRDEDAGRVGRLALRDGGQALAVGAEEARRAGDVLALAGDGPGVRDATRPVRLADAAASSAVRIALALRGHDAAIAARAVLVPAPLAAPHERCRHEQPEDPPRHPAPSARPYGRRTRGGDGPPGRQPPGRRPRETSVESRICDQLVRNRLTVSDRRVSYASNRF